MTATTDNRELRDRHTAVLEAIRERGQFPHWLDLVDVANALDAAIALMRGQSWQSIETAPKDGTSILATEIDGEPVVSYFDEGGWVYSWHAYDGYRHWNPTHWQPLPAPPKDTADEQ